MSMIADSVQLLSFLGRSLRGLRRVRLQLAGILSLAVVSGLANTGLLALINSALSRQQFSNHRLALSFAALCLLLPASRFASGALLVRLTGDAIRDLRVRLSWNIVASPLRRFEEQGAHRVLNVLTTDIASVTAALYSFPTFFMQMMIVVSSLVYLGFLSWRVLAAVLVFMAAGIASYRLPIVLAMRHFRQGRSHSDVLMRHFRAVTEGGKELRLHEPRQTAFFRDELEPAASALSRSSVAANTILAGTTSWGQILFFVLIGLVLFGLPALRTIPLGVVEGYSLVILYMMTPLEYIMNALPAMSQAAVAVQTIERMGLGLGAGTEEATVPRLTGWRSLELSGVTHAYTRDSEAGSFELGPVDLTLRPGELLFVIGGNGSGKTTLAKLITGLYRPQGGEIRLDGQTVTEESLPWYRQHFSAVFADFHLFDKLLGLGGPDLDERAQRELSRLKLDHKIEVRGGVLSTLDLSQGQRKRLALMTACLEDRPIYLFDEWAADQDPFFREIFYREILPLLKAKGKALIVISHDDRYYSLADRIVKLEYGRVIPAGEDVGVACAPGAVG